MANRNQNEVRRPVIPLVIQEFPSLATAEAVIPRLEVCNVRGVVISKKLYNVFDNVIELLLLRKDEGAELQVFLTNSGAAKLSELGRYQLEYDAPTGSRPLLAGSAAHPQVVPPFPILRQLWGLNFTAQNKLCFITNRNGLEQVSVAMLFSAFAVDGRFRPFYDDYVLTPDPGVTFDNIVGDSEDICLQWLAQHHIDHVAVRDVAPSLSTTLEREFSALMIALCGIKSFDPQVATHYDEFTKKRATAFAAQNAGVIDINHYNSMVDSGSFKKLNVLLNVFPNAREQLYRYVLTTSGNLQTYACTILKESQATHFTFIHDFLTRGERTLAHFDPSLSSEINRYVEVYLKLKATYGPNLPYYKIYCPTDTSAQLQYWPNLARVAVLHKHMMQGGASLSQLRGIDFGVSRRLIAALATPVRAEFLEDAHQPVALNAIARDFIGYKQGPLDFEPRNDELMMEIIGHLDVLQGRPARRN